jgi:hypothetical protein
VKSFVPVAIALSLILPALAGADPFSDFRIPDHSWRSGILGASVMGDWFRGGASYLDARQSSFASRLNPSILIARDSDPLLLALSMSLSGDVAVQNSEQVQTSPPFMGRTESHMQGTSEYWAISGTGRAYPWVAPVGFGLSATAVGNFSQEWTRNDTHSTVSVVPTQRYEATDRMDDHFNSQQAVIAAFTGLGRVRDATVVHDVHVLEERLRETGAITRPLSKEAREKLAALSYIAPFYADAHDRPERYFWRDIERVLREDGALNERGFDPYSVLRAQEPYFYRVVRQRGWFAGPVVQGRHSRLVQRDDEHATSRFYLDDSLAFSVSGWSANSQAYSFDEVDLGGTAEYHLPFGWRWQFDVESQVSAPVRSGESGLHAFTGAAATWLVADRWLAQAKLDHARDYFQPRGAPSVTTDTWAVTYGVQLGWYLEDHAQLSAALTESQARNDVDFFPRMRAFSRERRLTIGFTYRFLGGLDAAGLIEPQRRMR